MMSNENLLASFQQRVNSLQEERLQVSATINTCERRFDQLVKQQAGRPKKNESQLQETINSLEYQRTRNSSLSATEEKRLVGEMQSLRSLLKQWDMYREIEKELKEVKERKNALWGELKGKEKQISELEGEIKRIEISIFSGISPNELMVVKIEIPVASVSKVIGKKGSNLKSIERECKVSIDIDGNSSKGKASSSMDSSTSSSSSTSSNTVEKEIRIATIQGGAFQIEMAKRKIEDITRAIEEDIPLSDELLSALINSKSPIQNSIPNEYNFSYFDVNRQNKKITVCGFPEQIEALKLRLRSIDSIRVSLDVNDYLIPAVVGRSGSNFKELESKYAVTIDIVREDGNGNSNKSSSKSNNNNNSKTTITPTEKKDSTTTTTSSTPTPATKSSIDVRGLRNEVYSCVEELQTIIFTNKDREEEIEVDDFMIKILLDSNGKIMKEFRKEAGGMIRVEDSAIKIKAANYKVDDSVTIGRQFLKRIEDNICRFDIDASFLPYIIGKRGSTVTKIRNNTKCFIETRDKENLILLYHPDNEQVKKATDEIKEVIKNNQTKDIPMLKDSTVGLKGASGKEMRDKIVNELGLIMDIDSEHGIIKMRGPDEKISIATQLLNEFVEKNYSVELDLDADEQDAFTVNGEASVRKKLESELGVTIYCNREDGSIKIRGNKENVFTCESKIRALIEGPEDGSCISIPISPDILGTLIGKKQANLKKFKEKYEGCDFIPMKRASTLRIRGDPMIVKEAQKYVMDYLKNVKIFTGVNIKFHGLSSSSSSSSSSISKSPSKKGTSSSLEIFKSLGVDDLLATHDAQVEIEDNKDGDAYVKIRGAPVEVSSLKKLMQDLGRGRTTTFIALSPLQLERIKQDEDAVRWQRIQNKNGVTITIKDEEGILTITGSWKAISKTKHDVFRQLNYLCPAEFETIPLELDALPFFAQPEILERIKEEAQVYDVTLDRQFHGLRINGDMRQNQVAEAVVRTILDEWRSLHTFIEIESNYVISQLIGKGGKSISEIETTNGVEVDFDNGNLSAKIKGKNPAAVLAAKEIMLEKINKIMKEHAEIYITKELIPAIVGTKGNNIKKFKDESGASFDIIREDVPYVKIRGSEEAVIKGKSLVNSFLDQYNENNHVLEIDVTPGEYGLVLGKGGSRVKMIEEQANVNIELLRDQEKLQIRGNPSQVIHARGLIVKQLESSSNKINGSGDNVGSESTHGDAVNKYIPGSDGNSSSSSSSTTAATFVDSKSNTTPNLFSWATASPSYTAASTAALTASKNNKKNNKKKNKKKISNDNDKNIADEYNNSQEKQNIKENAITSGNNNGQSTTQAYLKNDKEEHHISTVDEPSSATSKKKNPEGKGKDRQSSSSSNVNASLSSLLNLSPSSTLASTSSSSSKGTNKMNGNKESSNYVKSSSGVNIRL